LKAEYLGAGGMRMDVEGDCHGSTLGYTWPAPK
jgi:hypothetical protein